MSNKPDNEGRIGKQCRERWNHHLRPDIRKDAWTDKEEELLVKAHTLYGNRWSDIARYLPGRTENAVKNHWNATLRRKDLKTSGVPQTLKMYMQSINLLPGGLVSVSGMNGAPGYALVTGSTPASSSGHHSPSDHGETTDGDGPASPKGDSAAHSNQILGKRRFIVTNSQSQQLVQEVATALEDVQHELSTTRSEE